MMPMESALRCLSSRNQDLQKLKRHHIKNGGNLEPSSGQIPRPHRRHRFGHPVKSHHLRSCRWFACQMPIAEPTKIPYKGKKSATGTYWNHLEPSTSPIPGSKITCQFISWYLSCPSLSQISACTSRLSIYNVHPVLTESSAKVHRGVS